MDFLGPWEVVGSFLSLSPLPTTKAEPGKRFFSQELPPLPPLLTLPPPPPFFLVRCCKTFWLFQLEEPLTLSPKILLGPTYISWPHWILYVVSTCVYLNLRINRDERENVNGLGYGTPLPSVECFMEFLISPECPCHWFFMWCIIAVTCTLMGGLHWWSATWRGPPKWHLKVISCAHDKGLWGFPSRVSRWEPELLAPWTPCCGWCEYTYQCLKFEKSKFSYN